MPKCATCADHFRPWWCPQGHDNFCEDSDTFRPVVASFGPGHGLDDMVARVIEFCRVRLLWDELLAEVAEENPAQYARFKARLSGKKRKRTGVQG